MNVARVGPDGMFSMDGLRCRAALGRGGLTVEKREGDGATPLGRLTLRRVLFRADRLPRPRTTLPVMPLAPQDGWCDDPDDRAYNQPVTLPFTASHEALWRSDAVYDLIGVMGWNDQPVQRGRGSAIFLHVARPDYSPTKGCIALARIDLLSALAAGLSAIDVQEVPSGRAA